MPNLQGREGRRAKDRSIDRIARIWLFAMRLHLQEWNSVLRCLLCIYLRGACKNVRSYLIDYKIINSCVDRGNNEGEGMDLG